MFDKSSLWVGVMMGLLGGTLQASAGEVASPDGKLAVSLSVQDGQLSYSIKLAAKEVVLPSLLGLETSAGNFANDLKLVEESPSQILGKSYMLPNGKRSSCSYLANKKHFLVENAAGQRLGLIVQISNDGVALAYQLQEEVDERVTITKELTSYAFPLKTHAFLHPMDKAKEGWSKTFPSYEAHYSIDQPVGEPSPTGVGWCYPALFHAPEAGWALLSETGVDGNYCGSHLAHESQEGVYHLAFPQVNENLDSDPVAPVVAGNAQLPWRTIYVGQELADIVESTLDTDLVDPEYPLDQLPAFGKAAWSWVFLKDDQTVYDMQARFVDMASQLHWDYVLVDSMWDTQIGKEKIAELVKYAADKGVKILLWYNSNGQWNDAPMGPKNRMHEPEVREEEMSWMESVGVAGIKVDFFGGDKQAVMQLYEAILRDAAKHHLAVNFHGTTIPRGWERMFPNYVTNEAVMGMEFCTFEQPHADAQPEHCCVLPFTRNVIGPMDFTPVILSKRLAPNNRGPERRTSDAFELALLVIFQSGVQHLGVTPEQVAEQPQEVREFLTDVPTVWDETRLLDGYPGKFAVIARRSGERWFVGAINGEDQPHDLSLDLSFVANDSSWTQLEDGADGITSTTPGIADKTSFQLTLQPHGGAVLWQGD